MSEALREMTYDEQIANFIMRILAIETPFSVKRDLISHDEEIPYDKFVRLVDEKQADEHNQSNPDNFSYSRNVDGYRFSDEEFC